jgi:diguanylate cyclase
MISRSKATFIRKAATLTVLLAAYFIAALFQSDAWGNILSPLNAFAAAGILYFDYLKSDRTIKVRVTLLVFALACGVWGIADTLWAIIGFSGGARDESPVLWIMYVMTNCFFLISIVIFAIQQFRKWDVVQLCVDLFSIGFISIILFWILFLHKDINVLNSLMASDFTSVLSMITDIIIGISIISWFLSGRGGKIPGFLLMVSAGMLLFIVVDLLYYYLDFNSLYLSNSIIDFLYILSLYIIAFGALWKTYRNSTVRDFYVKNTGGRRRWVYLLLFPAVMVIDVVTGFVPVRLSAGDFFAVGGPILFYWAACKYIQVSLEKEALLKRDNEILEQRVAEQVSELSFLANQDVLTTLFNRRYFMAYLDESMKNKRVKDTVALMIIDMDRFKTINDTYGHEIGDKVLIDLSYRMIEWNNYGATIARLGGDEFAAIFVGKYTQKDIEDFCTEIIGYCNKPLNIGDNALCLSMSVGIAIASADISDGKTLMQNADIAMYRAKAQGYNKYQVYDPIMSQDFKKAAEIEVLLRQTDAEKDFELFYQPQYTLPGKELIGAEALIRWRNPEHGYIPPNVFIPIAEQIDYIYKLGKWVMQETVRQSISWNRLYQLPLKVGFNISPKQLLDDNFIKQIKSLITESGVNPSWIDAEITESIMMNDEAKVDDVFSVLHELGISVSIDDFGSGYSALGYLNKYPFDRIKLDKSLVDNINSRSISGANVIRAAINMSHASGIQTIAEGVETQEQLDVLLELGCDQVQGYLLGRPVPAQVFEERYIKDHIKDHYDSTIIC